jgi:hypothetical protein
MGRAIASLDEHLESMGVGLGKLACQSYKSA